MSIADNTALGPPPLATPITQQGDEAGVPWQNRVDNGGVPSGNLQTSWAQWFNKLFEQLANGAGATPFGPDGTIQISDGAGNFAAAFLGVSIIPAGSTGVGNQAIGTGALAGNTTGSSNVAIANGALEGNTTGAANIAIGRDTLNSNDTGSSNVAICDRALDDNIAGNNNIAIGSQALGSVDDSSNVAVGFQALGGLSTGDHNAAIGDQAGLTISAGVGNTYLGAQAGHLHSGGDQCVFIGFASGSNATESYKLHIETNNGAFDGPLIGGDFLARTVTINGALGTDYSISGTPVTVATLPAGPVGHMMYCGDAKNFADDGAAVGSVAVGGGNGAMLAYVNGSWRTMC